MSSEIVERLRGYDSDYVKYDLLLDAASHIEALEYENKQMKLEFQRLAIDIAAEAAVASRAGQMKSLEGLSQFCLSKAKE